MTPRERSQLIDSVCRGLRERGQQFPEWRAALPRLLGFGVATNFGPAGVLDEYGCRRSIAYGDEQKIPPKFGRRSILGLRRASRSPPLADRLERSNRLVRSGHRKRSVEFQLGQRPTPSNDTVSGRRRRAPLGCRTAVRAGENQIAWLSVRWQGKETSQHFYGFGHHDDAAPPRWRFLRQPSFETGDEDAA